MPANKSQASETRLALFNVASTNGNIAKASGQYAQDTETETDDSGSEDEDGQYEASPTHSRLNIGTVYEKTLSILGADLGFVLPPEPDPTSRMGLQAASSEVETIEL